MLFALLREAVVKNPLLRDLITDLSDRFELGLLLTPSLA